jgi:hypothetical protein
MRRIVKKHVLVIVILMKELSRECKPRIFFNDKFREENSGLEGGSTDNHRRLRWH